MYQKLAADILFIGLVVTPENLAKYNLQFRKGKVAIDLIDARRKALKNGRAKIEFELSFFELYLKQVLKPIVRAK
jgi:hypothetical protein